MKRVRNAAGAIVLVVLCATLVWLLAAVLGRPLGGVEVLLLSVVVLVTVTAILVRMRRAMGRDEEDRG